MILTVSKVAALVSLLAMVLVVLGACGANRAEDGADSEDGSEAQVLRVGILPFTGYVPLYLADEENICAAHGIEMELVESDDQSALDTQVAKGDVDVGAYANTSLAFAAAAGLPLKAFLTLDQSVGADGVAVAGDVTSIQDMARQQTSFAADETDVNYFLFMALAEREGLSPEDFNHLQLGGQAGYSAFVAGEVDALGISEPLLSRSLRRDEARILLTSADAPDVISDVFVASAQVLEKKSDDLAAFSRCWYETVARLDRDPETAVPVMAERLGTEENELRQLLPGILWPGYDEGREYLLGGDLRDSLRFANDFYGARGELGGEPVPSEELITDEIVESIE